MRRENYAIQQAKIERQILKLQKKAEALQTQRRKPVLVAIINLMREYDINPQEIAVAFASARTTRRTARRNAMSPTTRRPLAPKYCHSITGETWSGRGRMPRWLITEEARGKHRNDFLAVKSPYEA